MLVKSLTFVKSKIPRQSQDSAHPCNSNCQDFCVMQISSRAGFCHFFQNGENNPLYSVNAQSTAQAD
jgi:hypothetical protein